MGKKLDLSKPIYELVTQYPELKDIMVELGFKEIANPAMLNSVGRLTTIPKGAKIHKISNIRPLQPCLFQIRHTAFAHRGRNFTLGAGSVYRLLREGVAGVEGKW